MSQPLNKKQFKQILDALKRSRQETYDNWYYTYSEGIYKHQDRGHVKSQSQALKFVRHLDDAIEIMEPTPPKDKVLLIGVCAITKPDFNAFVRSKPCVKNVKYVSIYHTNDTRGRLFNNVERTGFFKIQGDGMLFEKAKERIRY